MKTAQDFKEQAEKNKITWWNIHDCSMCGYPCGYLIHNGEVSYDNGCNCTGSENINPRTWEDIAGQYNMQSSPNIIQEYDKFWGFKPTQEASKEEDE